MLPPVVNMVTDPIRVWEIPNDATTPDFGLPFSVSDAHSGIKSWTVQSHPIGSGSWTFVISGAGAGPKEPPIHSAEGTRLDYRIVAKDRQGNTGISAIRRVYIPTDDDPLDSGFSTTPVSAPDPAAFGTSYSQMSSGTFSHTYTGPLAPNCLFELIGPGTGPWEVTVTADGGAPTPLNADSFGDLPRQTLYSDGSCATSYVVTWVSGAFGLDAVLG